MANVPDRIVDIIRLLIENASKDNINISKAILFGSYAKGTQTDLSDIDVAVVSEDFEGNSFIDGQKLNKAILKTSIDLEAHTYRPEEFNADNPYIGEILSYGVRIL